jgi:type IV pilus assembly protein PilA
MKLLSQKKSNFPAFMAKKSFKRLICAGVLGSIGTWGLGIFWPQVLPAFALQQPSLIDVLQQQTIRAKQSEGKNYVGAMNRAQQAYFIEYNKFTNSLEKLAIGIRNPTENYNYIMRVVGKAAFHYAIPRDPRLKSYVGGVFIVKNSQREVPNAIVCEANSPGAKKPAEPTYLDGKLTCGANTRKL